MATNTGGGTTTSLNNTPQAVDDFYTAYEDEVLYFSVMANDLGGNAKVLWSVDNTSDDGSTDLVAKDVAGVCEYSELGAKISLTSDGRIKYDTTLLDSLAAGQTVTDQFTYAIRMSNGTLSWATVTVTLTGSNDGPVALSDVAAVDEDANVSGSVATNDSDVDNGAVLSYELDDPASAPVGLVFNADGSWTFDASSYDSLDDGEELILTIPYTVTDEHGAADSATLTITVTGTNDIPVAVADEAAVDEDASTSGSVATNDSDADAGAVLGYALDDPAAAPVGLVFNADGSWTFDASSYDSLDDGEELILTIPYTVTDEHGAADSATLTITVTGTNDGPVANADTDTTSENAVLMVDVLANDTDADDGAVLTVTAASAPAGQGSASVVANQVQFDPGSDFDYLAVGESAQVVVGYSIEDEHGAGDSSTLTITVTGTNDQPALTAAQAVLGAGTEDTDYNVTSAALLTGFSDPDSSDVLAVFGLTADHGTVVQNLDGSYTITPEANYNGTVTLNYSVIDGNGGSAPATLSFNLAAVNDPALFGGLDYQYVGENDSVNTVGGDLNSTDVDGVDDAFIAVASPTASDKGWGTYTIDASGNWTYTLDNSNPEVDALGLEDASDSFTVYAADGTAKVINIYIAGNNDAAVISGVTTGSVTEATPANPGVPSATGSLTAADVDNPPNTFIAVATTPTASGYGSFTMSAAGVWNYTLNNANVAVNALATGMFLLDTFTVQSADGTTQTITVTINGATDAIVQPATYNGTGDPNDFDSLLAGSAAASPGTFNGGSGPDTIHGSNGVDTINGGTGVDALYGHDGNDALNGQNGADMSLYGQAGDDTISGGSGGDQIFGGSGADTILGFDPPSSTQGGDAGDTIYGGSGSDVIYGQGGDDLIIGGYGADTMTGGNGADTFRFLDLFDTNDVITDFLGGTDKLDFTALDANSAAAGNQAFGWGGDTPTANGLWMVESGGNTVVYGDTDGNVATAEFMVTLTGFTGFDPLVMPPEIMF